MTDSKISDIDAYGILDLDRKATTAEVRRAYRQKALKCHPDKNPDDPKAAETFLQLTKALEILLDTAARAAYDRLLDAKEAAKKRHRELDDRRKRFKEDLEARERAASRGKGLSEEEQLRNEIDRLRKEGAKLVQEELKTLNEELLREKGKTPKRNEKACQLKIQWDKRKTECHYTEESLRRIFCKYGNIVALVVSDKKALLEFEDAKAAELAIKIEVGFVQNPLKVNYASSKLRLLTSNKVDERQKETLTERSARQAEERKRLIEQMLREEAELGAGT